MNTKLYNPYCVTIDRINPTGGYIRENVQLVSRRANIAKSDMTLSEFVDFCRAVLNQIDVYTLYVGVTQLGRADAIRPYINRHKSTRNCVTPTSGQSKARSRFPPC